MFSGDEYPVLTSSPRSGEIIFEKKSLSMMLAKEEEPHPRFVITAQTANLGDLDALDLIQSTDEGLFAALRDLRGRLAREAHVPSYIIFTDASLRDMCRKKPRTLDQFESVSGVGLVKMGKYGEAFTKVIREHQQALSK
jgi:ATP-dependent DNA helicase RecQ